MVPVILTDDDLVLEPTTDSELTGWTVVVGGERIGTIAIRAEDGNTASVRWNTGSGDKATWTGARALSLVIDHAFSELGYTRIEARVPVDRMDAIRAGLDRRPPPRGHRARRR